MSLDTHGYEVSNSLFNLDMREPASGSQIRGPDARALLDHTESFDGPDQSTRQGAKRSAIWLIGQGLQRGSRCSYISARPG